MSKTFFTSIAAMVMALFLVTACAEDSKNTEATAKSESTAGQTEALAKQEPATEEAVGGGDESDSLMNQPVDFSTPEAAEKTLQNIREQEGDSVYTTLDSAMQYTMYYDLSLGGEKEKLYKKLNGKTPNEIIAMMRR